MRWPSTILDFSTMEVVRIGTCCELVRVATTNQFGITLRVDPGHPARPSGYLREQSSAS
jgi:hypothetical protein